MELFHYSLPASATSNPVEDISTSIKGDVLSALHCRRPFSGSCLAPLLRCCGRVFVSLPRNHLEAIITHRVMAEVEESEKKKAEWHSSISVGRRADG